MLAEVARELEDPFSGAPNELPLSHLHGRLNRMLLDLVITERKRTNKHKISNILVSPLAKIEVCSFSC